MALDTKRKQVTGCAVPVAGDDIDTDRIIPARFMKGITFEGLGDHAFEDARADEKKAGRTHPFDDVRYKGASVLLVNKNFGCGSSREHAPQALMRWGIKAVVGESFAEIFFGNCVTLGMPAVIVGEEVIKRLQASAAAEPAREVVVDVEKGEIRYAGGAVPCVVPPGVRKQLLEGSWDGTSILLAASDKIKKTAGKIPYITGF